MKDLISREKALDCFHDWVDKYGDVHTADEMTEYQAIEALPTEKSQCALCQYNDLEWDEEPCESCTGENNHFKAVQPERKTGKWTIYDRHTIPYQYICSECGAYHRAMYDFCPTCGAEMRGETDGR